MGATLVVLCGCIGGAVISLLLATDRLLATFAIPIGLAVGAGGAGVLASYRRKRAIAWSMLLCYLPPSAVAASARIWIPDQAIPVAAAIFWLFCVLITADYGWILRQRRR
ncbi:MAG: hypothetical protein AMXMBFR58_22950 [Phycisphaerae bacterium]